MGSGWGRWLRPMRRGWTMEPGCWDPGPLRLRFTTGRSLAGSYPPPRVRRGCAPRYVRPRWVHANHSIRFLSASKDLVGGDARARTVRHPILSELQTRTAARADKPVLHVLSIPCSFAAEFRTHVGFSCATKAARLDAEASTRRGWQPIVPGSNSVLEEARCHAKSTAIRKELRRIQRRSGVTLSMLLRCRDQARECGAPPSLLEEFEHAIRADVWWDPIVSIEARDGGKEMVYDFTVDDSLQSFMLSNGLFVHNTLNSFHTAGVVAQNVSTGLPRIKELIDVSKNAHTPCTVLRFHDSTPMESMRVIATTTLISGSTTSSSAWRWCTTRSRRAPPSRRTPPWSPWTRASEGWKPPARGVDLVVRHTLRPEREHMRLRALTPVVVRDLYDTSWAGTGTSSSDTNAITGASVRGSAG